MPREPNPGQHGSGLNLGFLRWAYAELSLLVDDDPFSSDVWQARRVKPGREDEVRNVDWTQISQPWLRAAAKRWAQVRATTVTLGVVSNDARRLARFGQFLASRIVSSSGSTLPSKKLPKVMPLLICGSSS